MTEIWFVQGEDRPELSAHLLYRLQSELETADCERLFGGLTWPAKQWGPGALVATRDDGTEVCRMACEGEAAGSLAEKGHKRRKARMAEVEAKRRKRELVPA